MTGKKKVRIDLNKEQHIPRDLFLQFTTDEGKKYEATVRNYYKDQPWTCRTCKVKHVGDCPEWLKENAEKESAKKIKEDNIKTAFIGDSNNRCINESGVMASVTAITGAKIGHVANQLAFENLEKIENVVISAGQNCINDIGNITKEAWQTRTMAEIAQLESAASSLMSKGKNIYLVSVPPTPCTQIEDSSKEARRFINTRLNVLTEKLGNKWKSKGNNVVRFLEENEGNFNPMTDFKDDKHLSQLAVERRLSLIDEMLPKGKKIRNPSLSARSTCAPYRGCYGAYPVGCNFCTRMKHSEADCPKKNPTTSASQIRKNVSSSDISPEKKKPKD